MSNLVRSFDGSTIEVSAETWKNLCIIELKESLRIANAKLDRLTLGNTRTLSRERSKYINAKQAKEDLKIEIKCIQTKLILYGEKYE